MADDPEVTAAVTPLTPWEAIGMDKDTWDQLEIPAFLRRSTTGSASSTPPGTRSRPKSATAPAVGASGGEVSGSRLSAPTVSGMTGTASMDFSQFRVDPTEIETKIRQEADKRWRNWMPTKESRARPRLSTYIKQVRREFYK